eukprot:CFRG3566T1
MQLGAEDSLLSSLNHVAASSEDDNGFELVEIINDDNSFLLERDIGDNFIASDEHENSGDGPALSTSKCSIVSLHTWWIGVQAMWLLLTIVIIPSQVRSLVGDEHKGKTIGMVTAFGAIFALVGSPLMGALSDRSTFSWGRRRPFMLGGMCLISLGLLGMGFSASTLPPAGKSSAVSQCHAHTEVATNKTEGLVDEIITTGTESGSLLAFIVSYIVVSSAYVIQSVPYNGLIADRTPSVIRGASSGVMGTFCTIGNVLGSLLGIWYVQVGVVNMYLIIIGLVWVTGMITITMVDERRPTPAVCVHPPEKTTCMTILHGCVEPLKRHDFRWVFLTRFLMQQGVSSVTGFLQYSLSDRTDLGDMSPETAIGVCMLPMLIVATVSSVSAGWLSDIWGKRRRIFVMGSVFIMAGCGLAFAFVTNFQIITIFTSVFGVGYGAFLAVDFAMVMDILPDNRENARDIAVWHSALVIPNMIAAPIAGILRDTFQEVGCGCECGLGYIVVFLNASVYFLLSGLFVLKIRGIR